MKVEAVLFDLFNTLVLLEDGDAFYLPSLKKLHRFLVKSGVKVSFETFESVYFQVRDMLYSESEKTLEEPHFRVRISRTLQQLGYDFGVTHPLVIGATEAFCMEFMRYISLDEDAIHVLRRLHGKYRLGIVSNFAMPECAEKLFDKFDLNKFFDVVVISAAVNRRKPSPEIFRTALTAMGVRASETVFVGDTPAMDVIGPRNVGIRSVLIKRKTSPPSDSISLVYKSPKKVVHIEPDHVIESLRELLTVLEDC